MRHLRSLILALILGPLIWLLVIAGYVEYGAGQHTFSGGMNDLKVTGLVALAAAGLLYAVLLVPRLSPVGPVVVGLSYLAVAAWEVLNYPSMARVLPRDIPGTDIPFAPSGHFALLLSIALLATVLSPSRWRGRDRRPAPVVPAQPAPQGDTEPIAPAAGVSAEQTPQTSEPAAERTPEPAVERTSEPAADTPPADWYR